MKGGTGVGVLKVFDLVVLTVAFAFVAFPHEHMGLLAQSVTAATASDAQFAVASSTPLQELLSARIAVESLLLFGAFMIVWHALFTVLGLYSAGVGGRLRRRDLAGFGVAGLLAAVIIWSFSYLVHMAPGAAAAATAASIIACAVSLLARLLTNALFRRGVGKATRDRHVVVVGTNRRALEVARQIESNADRGLRLVGFVDERWSGDEEFRKSGYKVIADFAGFQHFLKDQVVDEVVICTPLKSLYDVSAKLFAQCEQQGITVRFRTDPFSPTIGRSKIDEFGGQPVMTIDTTPPQRASIVVKRLIDIVGSALLLVFLAPVMIAIAIGIKLDSNGPVFFLQERVGFNKRRFRLIKYRTMVVDAEKRLASLESMNEVTGPVFKIKRDPRVTTFGRFLRKSSLDELPQFINVLKGDMSLVGPRPLAVRDYNGITEDWQRRRLSVPPGITCLWQVMGRSSIPFERWMELDLEYIDNWSLLLDLKICLKTVPAVITGDGAS